MTHEQSSKIVILFFEKPLYLATLANYSLCHLEQLHVRRKVEFAISPNVKMYKALNMQIVRF